MYAVSNESIPWTGTSDRIDNLGKRNRKYDYYIHWRPTHVMYIRKRTLQFPEIIVNIGSDLGTDTKPRPWAKWSMLEHTLTSRINHVKWWHSRVWFVGIDKRYVRRQEHWQGIRLSEWRIRNMPILGIAMVSMRITGYLQSRYIHLPTLFLSRWGIWVWER